MQSSYRTMELFRLNLAKKSEEKKRVRCNEVTAIEDVV